MRVPQVCPACKPVQTPGSVLSWNGIPQTPLCPQVSLVEQPEFDFDLTLGSSTDVPMEPALKSWIKQ